MQTWRGVQRSKTERRCVRLSWYGVATRGWTRLLAGLQEEEIPSHYQQSGCAGAFASQGRVKVNFLPWAPQWWGRDASWLALSLIMCMSTHTHTQRKNTILGKSDHLSRVLTHKFVTDNSVGHGSSRCLHFPSVPFPPWRRRRPLGVCLSACNI